MFYKEKCEIPENTKYKKAEINNKEYFIVQYYKKPSKEFYSIKNKYRKLLLLQKYPDLDELTEEYKNKAEEIEEYLLKIFNNTV
ncbi:hypothetical protein NUSPORA_02685 [Nucleospora cyclopteri]